MKQSTIDYLLATITVIVALVAFAVIMHVPNLTLLPMLPGTVSMTWQLRPADSWGQLSTAP